MMLRAFVLLLSIPLLAGCTPVRWLVPPLLWVGVTVQPTGEPPSGPTVEAELSLTYGATATLPDMGLALTFQEVLEDSRCPLDVECVWSGWVRIALVAQAGDEPAATLEITAFTDSEGKTMAAPASSEAQPLAEYKNYYLALEQVIPYPARHADRSDPADYQIRLTVRQEMAQVSPLPPTDGPLPIPTPLAVASCPEDPRLPVLCYSLRAVTEYAAGVRTASPMQLTEPMARCQLPDQATGDALCRAFWGEEWEMAEAEKRQQTSNWYAFLPAGSAYWMWDEYEDELVAEE